MDKMLRMRKNPKDNVSEPREEDAIAFKKGMERNPLLEKLGAMMGMGNSIPKSDPNMMNRHVGGTVQVDNEPDMRSQEGDNSDMMKYLPKKQPSMVPNSMQPISSQPEMYDAIDSSQEDPKIAARKRALMVLQGQ